MALKPTLRPERRGCRGCRAGGGSAGRGPRAQTAQRHGGTPGTFRPTRRKRSESAGGTAARRHPRHLPGRRAGRGPIAQTAQRHGGTGGAWEADAQEQV
eukprot:14360596-Alexandrium_andersonii.AAC.2